MALMLCPRCSFSQPKDQYCANCGLNVDTYIVKPLPWWKDKYGVRIPLLLFCLFAVVGIAVFIWTPNRQFDLDGTPFAVHNPQRESPADLGPNSQNQENAPSYGAKENQSDPTGTSPDGSRTTPQQTRSMKSQVDLVSPQESQGHNPALEKAAEEQTSGRATTPGSAVSQQTQEESDSNAKPHATAEKVDERIGPQQDSDQGLEKTLGQGTAGATLARPKRVRVSFLEVSKNVSLKISADAKNLGDRGGVRLFQIQKKGQFRDYGDDFRSLPGRITQNLVEGDRVSARFAKDSRRSQGNQNRPPGAGAGEDDSSAASNDSQSPSLLVEVLFEKLLATTANLDLRIHVTQPNLGQNLTFEQATTATYGGILAAQLALARPTKALPPTGDGDSSVDAANNGPLADTPLGILQSPDFLESQSDLWITIEFEPN